MDIAKFDVPRYLSMLPLFHEMRADDLLRLAQGARLRRLVRNDNVFRAGEPCEEFHVTVVGQVKLFALSPNGQEKVIELIGPGHSFAEALMFTDQPYLINAQALMDTLLLSVSKAAVVREIENDPRIARAMLAGLARRLHGLVHDVQSYTLDNGVQRVIGFLLRDAPDRDGQGSSPAWVVQFPVSKATIASRLSLTPEYFSRVLHELETEGLLKIERRDIRIPDLNRLARYPM